MLLDSKTIVPFLPQLENKDEKRPVIIFFNPPPEPVMTSRGVNGDNNRRYVDIGTKHLRLIDQEFEELKKNTEVMISDKTINNGDPSVVRYARFGPIRKSAGQ